MFLVEDVRAEDKYPRDYMYAYVRLEGSAHSVAEQVARWSRDSSTPLSETKCRHIMRTMARQEIVSRAFTWDTSRHRPRVDRKRGMIRIPPLIYTSNAVFVAVDLFLTGDPIDAAIQYTVSSLTPSDRKYVRAVHHDINHPQLLAVRHVRRGDGVRHVAIDYARQRTASTMFASAAFERLHLTKDDLNSGERRLQYHYDEMSARARAIALYMDEDVDGVGECSFEPYERVAHAIHVRHQTATYPEEIIAIDTERSRQNATEDVLDTVRIFSGDQRVPKRPMILDNDYESNDDDDNEVVVTTTKSLHLQSPPEPSVEQTKRHRVITKKLPSILKNVQR
jgi:hypothetical protein